MGLSRLSEMEKLIRDDDGTWQWESPPPNTANAEYTKVMPIYFTAYDQLFIEAKKRSEFEFVYAIVEFETDANLDPFETTKKTFREMLKLHNQADGYAADVLALWLYGHMVEASYPYQLIGDLAMIAAGQQHKLQVFPRDSKDREIAPGPKISQIEKILKPLGLKACLKPMDKSWHPDLRNAIFHSNYALVGSDIYLPEKGVKMPFEDAMNRVNRAIASFNAFEGVLNAHRSFYPEPVEIEVPIERARYPNERATVVVREGYGPVALYGTLDDDDDDEKTPLVARMYAEEFELVRAGIFKLPPTDKQPSP
jgi:hypothetical protein